MMLGALVFAPVPCDVHLSAFSSLCFSAEEPTQGAGNCVQYICSYLSELYFLFGTSYHLVYHLVSAL